MSICPKNLGYPGRAQKLSDLSEIWQTSFLGEYLGASLSKILIFGAWGHEFSIDVTIEPPNTSWKNTVVEHSAVRTLSYFQTRVGWRTSMFSEQNDKETRDISVKTLYYKRLRENNQKNYMNAYNEILSFFLYCPRMSFLPNLPSENIFNRNRRKSGNILM